MIKWLQRIFIGHNHKWATIAEHEIVRTSDKAPVGHNYTMRCEECGKITHYNSWCT